MSSWIRIDQNLGTPCVVFTVGLRELRCHTPQLFDSREAEPLEKVLLEFVKTKRPNLAEGGFISSISMGGGLRIFFCYHHASLPRVPDGVEPPVERVQLCPACWKSIPAEGDAVRYVGLTGYNEHGLFKYVEVCNTACKEKLDQMPAGEALSRMKKAYGERPVYNATTLRKQDWIGMWPDSGVDPGDKIEPDGANGRDDAPKTWRDNAPLL